MQKHILKSFKIYSGNLIELGLEEEEHGVTGHFISSTRGGNTRTLYCVLALPRLAILTYLGGNIIIYNYQ
ncbi:unnamed protein product [Arctia plantaginis]|uniref:Uncharacterized protein n=1 Tax=Arctia plantaginis TaxID=874455 RepID=A0A8S1BN88_ARCPL|nr:unnamed protein product [Arctia plantaginis]